MIYDFLLGRCNAFFKLASELAHEEMPGGLTDVLNQLKIPKSDDQKHFLHLIGRSLQGLQQHDLKVFITSFGKIRSAIQLYQPDYLDEEFLIFVADREMWQWFDAFKRRSPTPEDLKYLSFIAIELEELYHKGQVFK